MATEPETFGAALIDRILAGDDEALQFDRRAHLSIFKRKELTAPTTTLAGTEQLTAFEITQLRIRASITKSWKWTPNIGDASVYNFNGDSRALLGQKGAKLVLSAGYAGEPLKQVVVMDARQITHKQEGPDWVSKFEGGDGGRAIRNGFAGVTFAPNTPTVNVVTGLLNKIGKNLGDAALKKLNKAAAGRVEKTGRTVQRNPYDVVRGIIKDLGLEGIYIEDDDVQLDDGDIVGVQAFNVAAIQIDKTGRIVAVDGPTDGQDVHGFLIGSPAFSSPPNPKQTQQLSIKMLLAPVIRIGSKLKLVSKAFRGEYKVRILKHTLDTHGGDWYTEVEAVALKKS